MSSCRKKQFIALLTLLVCFSFALYKADEAVAQQTDLFTEPEFVKIERVGAAEFQRRFRNTRWTGQGMQGITEIDRIPSMELRARFQTAFGNPTQTLEDLIFKPGFRLAEAIQYEYWFVIDDEIPMMVLDIDGPFANGLVYAVSVAYIDLMPQIKRALSEKLMKPTVLDEYKDVFFSPERNQWYEISFRNSEFGYRPISVPDRFRNVNLN